VRAGGGAALALLLAAGPAAAFQRSADPGGLCLWWGTRTVTWALSTKRTPSGCATFAGARALVQQAFAQWSHAVKPGEASPCTDFAFVECDATSSFAVGRDGQNVVVFRSRSCDDASLVPAGDACHTSGGCANKYDCWESDPAHGSGTLALTWTSYDTATGQILDADIELQDWNDSTATPGGWYYTCAPASWSAAATACTGALPYGTGCAYIDVGNTLTHESGHVLGLDHPCVAGAPCVDPNATMAATASVGEVSKRTLTLDDVNGVCAIYPSGQPTSTCLARPPASVSPTGSECPHPSSHSGCGCGGGPGSLGALGPVLWYLARRRRQAMTAPAYPTTLESSPVTSPLVR
jgi:hypothetical protein